MNIRDDSPPLLIDIVWRDSKGKKAKLDPKTPLAIESSDPNLFTIGATADGKPTIAVGPMDGVDADENGLIGGAVQVLATGDGDLGEGVRPVVAAGTAQLTSGEAQVGEINFVPQQP